jgi:Membrane-bound toxin component of toxin-antitoxin system
MAEMQKDRLDLDIKPSLILCMLLTLTHGVAISAIWLSGMENYHKAAFSLAVVVSLLYCLPRYGWLSGSLSVISVLYRDDQWFLQCKNGEKFPASLDLPVFVMSFLVVMNFRDVRGRKFPVAIFPDAIESRQLRHCRILLRFHPNLGGTKMVSSASSSKSG